MQLKTSPRRFLRPAVQLGLAGLAVAAALNYQFILDQYALATFRPAGDVSAIEARLGLTPKARATFYRAKPQIDSKAQFNQDCQTQPLELELGCYFRSKIYVLKIDNHSLASEMDVVMAHELLHAAWNAMSTREQQQLGEELQQVYQKVDDEELRQRMAGYAKSEPGEQTNELHSILATEYANLSPELETHYAKYFTQRAKIVAAHAAYQAVFDSRRVELEGELAQIRSLKGQLVALNRQMDSYKTSGQVERYNTLVPRQNALVDDINRRIEGYQQAVEEYNALSKSLDSREITDTETSAQ